MQQIDIAGSPSPRRLLEGGVILVTDRGAGRPLVGANGPKHGEHGNMGRLNNLGSLHASVSSLMG